MNSPYYINSPIKTEKIDTLSPINGNFYSTPSNAKNDILYSPVLSYRDKIMKNQDSDIRITLFQEEGDINDSDRVNSQND